MLMKTGESLMEKGNLSNTLARPVGVRFEAVVYNFGKVNPPGKALCERLLTQDCNLYLYSSLFERKVKAVCYKWSIPYSRVYGDLSPLEIPELVWAHKLVLYIDTDDRLLQGISERGNPQVETKKWTQPLESSAQDVL